MIFSNWSVSPSFTSPHTYEYDRELQLAGELWPETGASDNARGFVSSGSGSDIDDREIDLEKQVALEIASMKKPRMEQRFGTSALDLPRPFTLRKLCHSLIRSSEAHLCAVS
jgi:hypothetical protein